MNVDVVAAAMLGVLNSCSPAYGNSVFTAWHSRWMAYVPSLPLPLTSPPNLFLVLLLAYFCSRLTTAAALASNPALQARAFIVLGVLCRSSDLVTDDLMDQVLATLKNVCANPKSVSRYSSLFLLLSFLLMFLFVNSSRTTTI